MADTPEDVVLIHCHDLGTWLPFYGMPSVPSPQLSHFADRAVVFDNAFATAPLCTPARGSLFTGTSPHVNGLQGLSHLGWRYRRGVRTLPELLAPAGYRTVLVGLQHEHPDSDVLGFEEVTGQGFLPRAQQVVDETLRLLDERAGSVDQRPLFLTVGTWEVHRPWPAEDYAPADPDTVDVPKYLPDDPATRRDIAAFHGAIRYLDTALGRLFAAMDETMPDAMVVFTTDHGAAFPRAKGTLYDPGVRVAMVVRPPRSWGVEPGRRSALVSHLDLVPTVLEIAGLSAPDGGTEGTSLVPLLRGTSPHGERTLVFGKTYHDIYDPIRAVRTRRHKLIRNYLPGTPAPLSRDIADSPTGQVTPLAGPRPAVELYDLDTDPNELTDLADDPGSSRVRADLEARLESWMVATRDPLLAGPVPPPPPRSREIDALPALDEQDVHRDDEQE